MNNAKKVREMQEIYFIETKEHEKVKKSLDKVSKKYEILEILCKELIDLYDCNSDISKSIHNIKNHIKGTL